MGGIGRIAIEGDLFETVGISEMADIAKRANILVKPRHSVAPNMKTLPDLEGLLLEYCSQKCLKNRRCVGYSMIQTSGELECALKSDRRTRVALPPPRLRPTTPEAYVCAGIRMRPLDLYMPRPPLASRSTSHIPCSPLRMRSRLQRPRCGRTGSRHAR